MCACSGRTVISCKVHKLRAAFTTPVMTPALACGVPATACVAESQLTIAGVSNSRKRSLHMNALEWKCGSSGSSGRVAVVG